MKIHLAGLFLAAITISGADIADKWKEFEKQLLSQQNKEKENTAEEAQGVHWALIIAGSSGYFNYRHQVLIFTFY